MLNYTSLQDKQYRNVPKLEVAQRSDLRKEGLLSPSTQLSYCTTKEESDTDANTTAKSWNNIMSGLQKGTTPKTTSIFLRLAH